MDAPQVVLVEDDTNTAKLVQLGLGRAGYNVRHASTLDGARKLLSEGNWDLLVLDRQLPDGDGVDLCNEVRPTNPHGFILILTGDDSKEAKLTGFGCGADDYVTKPFQLEELVARLRAGWRIVELQKALLASNARLEELTRTDPLTGLRNRRSFDQEFVARFEHARRYNRPMAVAMIDIDHFKRINDTLGHQQGDAVLQRVAAVLRRCSRQSDLVARYGGEEFVVVLPETALLEALQFAEKIRASVAADDGVTVSLGIAAMPPARFNEPEAFLRAADEALYRAKESGRNRVEFERRESSERRPFAARASQN